MSNPIRDEKLHAPESAHSLGGDVTPSDVSVMDEKDRAAAAYDSKRHSSDGESVHADNDLARVESSLYPSSWKLVGILVGVSLSIFLVALDMVWAIAIGQ